MDLNQFLEIIQNMERRPFRPHRYLALMAIMDIIEQQEPPNRFYYNDAFKTYFTEHFNVYHGPNDRNRPFNPFFHLKNAGGFWFLSPRPGREADLNMLVTVGSGRELNEIVDYAYLHSDIFELLSNQESREKVRNVIKQRLEIGLKTKRTY
jgi:predicted restriction endonuclease